MRDQPAGLNCPGCGEPAAFALGPEQAFCDSDGCRVLMWDPALSVAANMAGASEVSLRPKGGS